MDFARTNELKNILVRSDSELGGYSTAHVDLESLETPAAPLPGKVDDISSSSSSSFDAATACATLAPKMVGHFHGVLNLDLPANRPDVVQSGYAMFRTRDQRARGFSESVSQMFGDPPHWDWRGCTHIMLRVKGDRRKYFVNIQADSPLPADIYQHRLFLKTPGQWETVLIPLQDFILTNWGVIQEQRKINTEYVKTIGIGLIDKQYGPFSLYVDRVEAINTDYVSPEGNSSQTESSSTPHDRLPGKSIPID